MRQLEVVAVSDDGTYVLLASAEDAVRATHAVRIDNRLHAALRGELEDDDRRESELSPKEIQSRLRAGETPEQVAKAARVPISRVMRYAGPVLSERERIIEQAQGAVLQRARGPELTAQMGEVVQARLAGTVGLRPETVIWTARRREDGAWVVALSYSAKGGSRSASWLWQPADRELSSLNGLATRLGAEDVPVARRKRPAARPAAKSPAKRTATKRAAPSRAAAQRATAKRRPVKVTAAKPKSTKRAVAKAAKPAPAKAATKRVAAKPTVKRAAPAKRATKAAAKPRKRPVPRVMEPAVVERVNGRVVVPSWSDVLLGVQAPAAARGRRRS